MISSPHTLEEYQTAADFIRKRTQHQPQVGLVLGSGLSLLAEGIASADFLAYDQIPHFPVSTVVGHAGRLVIGELAGLPVCAMQGRFHFYEGYSQAQVTFPIRVMHLLGIHTLILTNAAGGINPSFQVGNLMVIDDHINFMGLAGFNPLYGPNIDAFGSRFPSMTDVYSPALRALGDRVAAQQGEAVRHGVYGALSGPTFETPAEVRFLRAIGVDAVGMSTAPEATVARHAGMRVLGISTITNAAIDILNSNAETSHEEVLETGKAVVPRLMKLIMGVLAEIGKPSVD
ncbi:MAG: purine-nucleoside phosphorylase [Caldilineaceae bacterium]|nr:purine-nucleoside phosphorylase [Caldilineaceae bacterium]